MNQLCLKGATGGTSWSIEMLAQMSGNFKNFYFFRDFRGLKIKQIWKSFDFIHFHYSWKFIFWDFRSFSRNKSYLGIFGDPHPIPGKSIPIPKNPHPRGFFPKVTHPQSPSPSPGFGDGDRGSPKIPIPAASLLMALFCPKISGFHFKTEMRGWMKFSCCS